MSSEESESAMLSPPDNVNAADAAQLLNENLLPAKSKEKYIAAYDNFIKWRNQKNTSSFSENVLLAYFEEIAVKYKAASLWAIYSMLKSTLNAKNFVNIEQYYKLKQFLKRKSEGYESKKSNILTGENVEKFISDAPDGTYLATKVALIFGVIGALSGQELSNVTVDDIENHGEILLVKVLNTKNNIPRSFVISGNNYKIVKKYQAMRCTKATSTRFFQQIRNGKCTAQVIGKNKLSGMPKEIARYLNLPNASSYTGHSFRHISSTLLADSGANNLTLKKHGRWKSLSVAEGYTDDSIAKKISNNNKTTESVKSNHKVTESRGSIATTSSNINDQMPEFSKQEATDLYSADSELNSDDDISDEEASMFEETPAAAKIKGKGTKLHTASSSKRLSPRTDDEGFKCNVCSQDIRGFRYTCVQCADYDMCCACEARGHHAGHYVLRVPGPRPHSEVRAVVERVRQQLVGVLGVGGDPSDPPAEDIDEPSIKVEVKSELDPEPDPLLADSSHAAAAQPAATETFASHAASPRPWTILDEAMGKIKEELGSEEEGPDPPCGSHKRPAPRDDPPPKRVHVQTDSGLVVKAEPLEATEGGGDAAGGTGDTEQFEVFSHRASLAGKSSKVAKNIQKTAPVPGKKQISAKRKNK